MCLFSIFLCFLSFFFYFLPCFVSLYLYTLLESCFFFNIKKKFIHPICKKTRFIKLSINRIDIRFSTFYRDFSDSCKYFTCLNIEIYMILNTRVKLIKFFKLLFLEQFCLKSCHNICRISNFITRRMQWCKNNTTISPCNLIHSPISIQCTYASFDYYEFWLLFNIGIVTTTGNNRETSKPQNVRTHNHKRSDKLSFNQ